MIAFFEDERYAKYRYLTHSEYAEVFGTTVDSEFLPRINKKIVYGHFDFFNYSYNQTWQYKWYPVLAVFTLNTRNTHNGCSFC